MEWASSIKEIFEFILPFPERVPVLRAILGFTLVFFLPGFAWSFILFRQLGFLEKITLSFALSIALVTLSLLFANLVSNIRITALNSILVIIVVTILPVIVFYLNRLFKGKAERDG